LQKVKWTRKEEKKYPKEKATLPHTRVCKPKRIMQM